MPNTASAKKALRKSRVRRLRNRSRRSALRTMIKKLLATIEAGEAEEIGTAWRTVVKRLDQDADRNLLHKNAAARLKSRLSKRIPSDVWKQMHAKKSTE